MRPNLPTMLTALPVLKTEMLTRLTPTISTTSGSIPSGGIAGSRQENLLIQKDAIRQQWAVVETWAAELAWRSQDKDGDPALYIVTRLDWAEKNLPTLDKLKTDIASIYQTWTRQVKATAPRTGTICPRCARPLTAPTPETTYCPRCGERSLEQTENERHYRINQAGQWLTYHQARMLYGISWKQLHQAIRQGKLHPVAMPDLRHPRKQIRKMHQFELANTFPQVRDTLTPSDVSCAQKQEELS
ncbi:hypothetical protein [Mobiluncus curtisii]|uniref:hypothetical protein n=1 Tax=Mobiluncus curtisii TaxID=2051 RepID=UPI001470092C|nr:hypothetical protein [Mobiluncus curtisii]NMW88063.1 hypothetical protein [Mobiluncus curtisii]